MKEIYVNDWYEIAAETPQKALLAYTQKIRENYAEHAQSKILIKPLAIVKIAKNCYVATVIEGDKARSIKFRKMPLF